MTNDTIGTQFESAPPAKMDLRGYGRVLRRWKFLLLAIIVVIPLSAYLYERGKPKVYQSSTLMEVTGGQQSGVALLFNQIVAQGPDTADLLADARLVTTRALAGVASRYLHPRPSSPGALIGDVSASADQTTGFITITGTGPSGQSAANVANAFAQALAANQTQAAVKQVQTAIDQLQTQMATLAHSNATRAQLAAQLARFRALRAAQGTDLQVLDPATASSTPIGPRITRTVLLALLVALLLAIGTMAAMEAADRRIRHPDDASSAVGLPMLSAIPAAAFDSSGNSMSVQESFATLRSALTYFNIDRRVSSVLVTSAGKEEGKTTVTTQLAQSLARAGSDVVVVDADLRRPAVGHRLGVPEDASGLSAVLLGELTLDEALVEAGSPNGRGGKLRVLPAGPPPPNPSELLGSQRMRDLIAELGECCEVLLIDTTPLLSVSDPMPLLRLVSGVLLIARMNRTSREAFARLCGVVDAAGGQALGVVATGASSGGLYVARGYGYNSTYASGTQTNGSTPGVAARWRRGKGTKVGAADSS